MDTKKNAEENYDAIIIGSGQGGNPLAKDLAFKGWKTAVIERNYVGGSCINYGCTPSKTMAASADAANIVKKASEYGIHNSSIKINMKEIYERKKKIVESFRKGTLKNLKAQIKINLIRGEASFIEPKTIKVKLKNRKIKIVTADKIFINDRWKTLPSQI